MPGKDENRNNNILEALEVTKNYIVKNKKIEVLKDINLKMERGEKIIISGRSGMGKSTLINLLAGLEPPTSGEIVLNGHIINTMSNKELSSLRQRKVGIIFQNFNLLPSWTACENVEAALFFTGLSRNERKEKAVDMLTRVGLEDRLDNLPAELSVGQQQRVAVVRALINEPEIVFADEPTGDVDRETGGEIISLLTEWVERKKATLLIVTHGEFQFTKVDRELFLRDGSLYLKK